MAANPRLRQRAREAIAAELDQIGPAYRNTANSVRSGFENMWLTPSLDALERLLADVDDDEA